MKTTTLLAPVVAPVAPSAPEVRTAPSYHEAEVRQVALGGWRVTDRLVDPDSPAHLLGFIERHDDRLEVMLIGTEFTWTDFDTMEQAMNHLLTAGREAARSRHAGDLSWLAVLPNSSFDLM